MDKLLKINLNGNLGEKKFLFANVPVFIYLFIFSIAQ